MKFNGKNITELLAVNRRNFIKLAVGGAVGTGLSPLPWKLTDDVTIFTQNFPWVPVPEEGKFTKVKSHCTLCPGGCGIEVRKSGKRAVKIEGRTDHPINPGGICPLGMGGLQLLYNENSRFTGPMKRIGPRGAGKFQPITWDEALSTLTHRILELRNKGKAFSIVSVDGNKKGSTISEMIERFTGAVGSPNYMRVPSSEDTSKTATDLMFGSEGTVAYDLENSDYVLSFGSGLLEGWGAPGRVLNVWGLWKSDDLKDKVKIVQVESRASNTASKADKWVPARPGTESALALGIANVLIEKDLYDKTFIEKYTDGFLSHETEDGETHKGFKQIVLENYTPEKVSLITGISVADITEIAVNFSRADSPVAICGKGKGLLNGDTFEYMAVYALNALMGRINKPGGLIICDPLPLSSFPDVEIDDIAKEALKAPPFDRSEGSNYLGHNLFNNLTEIMLSSEEPVVDTMLVFASNPAFTLPDGGDFNQSLAQKTPFIVSFSPYLDETAVMADLVLPDHTYLEKTDEVVSPVTVQYPFYGLTQPVIEPLYDTRNCGDVILSLSEMIGGSVKKSFPWKTFDDVLNFRVRGLYETGEGITGYDPSTPAWSMLVQREKTAPDYENYDGLWGKLKDGGIWYNPFFTLKSYEDLFKTESGKFEFFTKNIKNIFEKSGNEILNTHPESGNKHNSMYPLKMMPYEIINLSSGWLPNPPYIYKTIFDHQLIKNDSFVEINPETAEKYNLSEGDRVTITSQKGEIEARVHLFDGAMPGIVYMPMGFGHTAFDDFVKGKGCNPNRIMGGNRDIVSGQPAWWDTPVRINKVYI